MKVIVGLILVIGSIGMVGLLCLLSFFISSNYWEDFRKEMEKRDERR